MGEVDAVIPEKSSDTSEITTTTASIVVNGDINGVCKTTEIMDIDTEDDSQISSENGGVTAAEETESGKVTNKKNIVINKNTECSSSSNSSSSTSSNSSSGTNSTNLKQNLKTVTMTATTPSSSKSSQCENVTEIDKNSQKTVKTNCNSKEGNEEKLEKNGPVQQQLENEEVIEKVQEKIESDNKKTSTVENDSKSKEDSQKMEVDMPTLSSPKAIDDNDNKEIHQKQSAEGVAVINDIKIDEKESNTSQSSVKSVSDESDKSDSKTSKTESSVNPMDMSKTIVNDSKISEDDDAVVIPSDSESDNQEDSTTDNKTTTKSDTKAKETTKKPLEELKNKTDDTSSKIVDDDVVEVLSDKDDCVVIEDDDKKDNTARRTQRQRKSASKARGYSSFDDDDDVTEIVDDSQPPLKRPRTSDSSILSQPIGQIGQITIRDARSLMATPYQDNAVKQNFNHNFPQKTNISTQPVGQNLTSTKPNATPFGVIPVGLQAQGVFPVNIRPALAPMSTASPKIMSTSITPATQSNLLSESPVLPNLTDDMFVLEAPSFIVPYIYEKPPSENLKEVVAKLAAEVKELEKEKETKEKDDKKEEEQGKKDGPTEETKIESDDSKKDKRRRKKPKNPDDSWGESDESTDDDASDAETRTKVLIKEAKNDITSIVTNTEALKQLIMGSGDGDKKSENYFDSPLGKFFIDIGIGLVQEYVQADLLRQQKRKRDKAKGNNVVEIEKAINLLKQNLQTSKDRNKPFKFEIKRCTFCNFKSESTLALAHHYETPHMRQGIYRCNFCPFEVRPPHDILFHMEAVHNIKGRLEKAPSYHQCPNCPFEDNGKSKLARHLPVCAKKFRPEHNLLPPSDWEAPAKIPRIKPRHGLVGTATAYQAMAAQTAAQKAALVSFTQRAVTPNNNTNNAYMRNRGRPQQQQQVTPIRPPAPVIPTNTRMRQVSPGGVVMPNVHMTGPQFIQVAGSNLAAILPNSHNTLTLQQQQQNTKKTGNGQPSISITPLPRQPNNQISGVLSNPLSLQSSSLSTTSATKPSIATGLKPGQGPSGSKASFVICEICDGYIKDLEQLRNHMQWMHKVKIHPKMIYNRPPLNCQKCQFRFFTDQGLERHLLGSHGLVTSSMQEAANKGKDAGRCPVCGRMYQWKLLNHVSRDHHMTLKPAHLSYKCTVCTATFGMYKQFENHVYTAHSTVAKKAMDNKKNNSGGNISGNSNNLNSGGSTSNQRGSTSLTSLSAGNDSLLKPLKINDEITIIPQPANKSRAVVNEMESHVID